MSKVFTPKNVFELIKTESYDRVLLFSPAVSGRWVADPGHYVDNRFYDIVFEDGETLTAVCPLDKAWKDTVGTKKIKKLRFSPYTPAHKAA